MEIGRCVQYVSGPSPSCVVEHMDGGARAFGVVFISNLRMSQVAVFW